MDKQQNELIKSYLRTRKIADTAGMNLITDYEYNYVKNNYPIEYLMKTDFISDIIERAKIYNEFLNNKIFNLIYDFEYANNTIAFAQLLDGSSIFINKKIEKSIEGISSNEITNIMDSDLRAAYFNTKLNTDKFYYIYDFKYANENIAIAQLKDKSIMFINKEGEEVDYYG